MLLHPPLATSAARNTQNVITQHVPTTDAERVHAAVAALSWLDREALVLRFRDHATVSGIAQRTGTTPAMVQVRLQRAARRVETMVGHWPDAASPVGPSDRDLDVMVEDAELGITPMFAGRLDAALRGRCDDPQPSQLARRTRQTVEVIASRTPQFATVVGASGLMFTTLAAMAAGAV